jgi:glycosyltransferase involved in cell wall biosynthesis
MDKPLVTVCVITYNSSKFILETLDSIKAQTYGNIELIVSDDCSTDNTVSICQEWINKNTKYFKRCCIDHGEINRGIPANCNKGIKQCFGEWVKLIAGDDILAPTCIEDLVNAISEEKDIIVGQIQAFYIHNDNVKKAQFISNKRIPFFSKTAERQHKILLINSFNFSPGAFVRRKLYDRIGLYDEKYPMIEDLPFWLKATKSGVKIYFCNHIVVYYRTHHESCVFTNKGFFNTRFCDCLIRLHKDMYKEIPFYYVVFYGRELLFRITYFLIVNLFHNNNNKYTRFISMAIRFPEHFLKLSNS